MQGTLAVRVRSGDVRAAARLMRELDDRVPAAAEVLRELFPHTGRAQVVGVTGAPGTGKSSLVDRLVGHARRAGRSVGVVAVDPTSPFSGGAILGDRIRMQDHALDPGVFIRSLATRGCVGGLSRSAADVVAVMDAMGKDLVLVETVGVGQDELEIAALAHTVVVVTAPGLGDDVQAIKAGVLEIADVLVVNKGDREGADRAVRELRGMLALRETAGWAPPVVATVAVRDQGVDELVAAVARHRDHLATTGEGRRRGARRARAAFLGRLRERLLERALARLEAEEGDLEELAERIAARRTDPYLLADQLAAGLSGAGMEER